MRSKGGHGWYALLALLSAAVVLPTFKYQSWTGLKYGRELGLAMAVMLLVVFSFFLRRYVASFPAMIANLIGIVTGMVGARAIHRYELTGSVRASPPIVSLIVVTTLVFFYFRTRRQQREVEEVGSALDKRYAAIQDLPDEERVQAMQEMMREALDVKLPSSRLFLLTAILATSGAALAIYAQSLRTSGPLSWFLTIGITLGAICLWWLYWVNRRLAKS